jgi:hypothetical protein
MSSISSSCSPEDPSQRSIRDGIGYIKSQSVVETIGSSISSDTTLTPDDPSDVPVPDADKKVREMTQVCLYIYLNIF